MDLCMCKGSQRVRTCRKKEDGGLRAIIDRITGLRMRERMQSFAQQCQHVLDRWEGDNDKATDGS